MLKIIKYLFSLFCFIIFVSVNSFAVDNNNEIKYGYPDQSIFIATIDGKEQPVTPMLLVAKELFQNLDTPWSSSSYPAKRLFKNLKSGETNFTILVRASSLVDNFIFSKKPIYSTDLNVYYIGDKAPITKKEDLVGSKLVTIRGYSYGSLKKFLNNPDNKIKKESTNTHKSAFEMLKLGRVDYLLDYASAADDIIAQSSISNIKSNKINQLDVFLVLSKSYPNAQEFMTKLEAQMESIDIDEIIRKSALKSDKN